MQEIEVGMGRMVACTLCCTRCSPRRAYAHLIRGDSSGNDKVTCLGMRLLDPLHRAFAAVSQVPHGYPLERRGKVGALLLPRKVSSIGKVQKYDSTLEIRPV